MSVDSYRIKVSIDFYRIKVSIDSHRIKVSIDSYRIKRVLVLEVKTTATINTIEYQLYRNS